MSTETLGTAEAHAASADSKQYLTFVVAGQEYAVEILRVQEIKGWQAATTLPNAPDFVLGVINLRGTVVPVVDLRRRFELEQAERGPTTVVVVLRVESEERTRIVGVVVDAVSDVHRISDEELKPPPEVGSDRTSDFTVGFATVDEKLVIVLDIDRLLNMQDLPGAGR